MGNFIIRFFKLIWIISGILSLPAFCTLDQNIAKPTQNEVIFYSIVLIVFFAPFVLQIFYWLFTGKSFFERMI